MDNEGRNTNKDHNQLVAGQHKPRSAAKSSTKRKRKIKQPLVHNKKHCFIPPTTLKNLQQYIDQKWPTGDVTKNEFCQGIHLLLDI